MQVTLIGVVGERLTMAMQSNSPALVCSAARAAGECSLQSICMVSCIALQKTGQDTTVKCLCL
jgi:hypothetical protein